MSERYFVPEWPHRTSFHAVSHASDASANDCPITMTTVPFFHLFLSFTATEPTGRLSGGHFRSGRASYAVRLRPLMIRSPGRLLSVLFCLLFFLLLLSLFPDSRPRSYAPVKIHSTRHKQTSDAVLLLMVLAATSVGGRLSGAPRQGIRAVFHGRDSFRVGQFSSALSPITVKRPNRDAPQRKRRLNLKASERSRASRRLTLKCSAITRHLTSTVSAARVATERRSHRARQGGHLSGRRAITTSAGSGFRGTIAKRTAPTEWSVDVRDERTTGEWAA